MKIESTNMKSFIALSDIISLLNMASGFLSIIFSSPNCFSFLLFLYFVLLFASLHHFYLICKNISKYIIIIIVFIWGCNGFDIALETQIASSGFSFATLKNEKTKYKR